jgi:heme/copper-type cytochrome/quinol oxidase subunit 2
MAYFYVVFLALMLAPIALAVTCVLMWALVGRRESQREQLEKDKWTL